jgi:hypothetical protein
MLIDASSGQGKVTKGDPRRVPYAHLLGKMHDLEIAQQFGVPYQNVYLARRRRGIGYDAGVCRPGRGRLSEYEHLLGKVPDAEIARQFGIEKIKCVRRAGDGALHSFRFPEHVVCPSMRTCLEKSRTRKLPANSA